jgi:hypothetical protein
VQVPVQVPVVFPVQLARRADPRRLPPLRLTSTNRLLAGGSHRTAAPQ